MIKSILVSTLLIGTFGLDFGQHPDNYEIQQKYWYYRWRLRNDFLFIGTERGESLPMIERNISGGGNFGTGDITQMLAYYILTLSTEYKLLNDQGRWQDLEMTKTELYYAFLAFERLDENAERLYPHVYQVVSEDSPFDQTPVNVKKIEQNFYDQFETGPNGYFMREDFPRDFFGDDFSDPCSNGNQNVTGNEHYEHFNSSPTRDPSMILNATRRTGDHKVQAYIEDPFAGCGDAWFTTDDRAPNNTAIPGHYVDMSEYAESEPSIDQIANLLEAFLVVKVSVPDQQVTVPLLDGTTASVNFVQMAKDNAERIINHLKYNPNGSGNNGWRITTPSGYAIPGSGQPSGGAAGQFSFPIAQIGNMMFDHNLLLPYLNIPSGFHNVESIVKRPQWNLYQSLTPLPNNSGAWNSHASILHYASVSNSWLPPASSTTGSALSFINNPMWLLLKKAHTQRAILKISDGYAWDPYHAMLFGYLHGVDMNDEKISNKSEGTASSFGIDLPNGKMDYVEYTRYQLDHAPCEGPHSFDDQPQTLGWNVAKRWNASWYSQANTQPTGGGYIKEGAYFSGLDFMALHNLYYLNSDAPLPQYVNYIDRYVDNDLSDAFPFNAVPMTYAGFVSLTADNLIDNGLTVTYKASEVVTLKPGFHAERGADFHAYTGPVLCGDHFLKSGSPEDTLTTSYGMAEVSLLMAHADNAPKFDHLYVMPDTIARDEWMAYASQMEKIIEQEMPSEEMIRMQMASLEVSPNPAGDHINTYCTGLTGELTYEILDANGKLWRQGIYSENQTMLIENLPSGLYLLKISESEIYVFTKFVKK